MKEFLQEPRSAPDAFGLIFALSSNKGANRLGATPGDCDALACQAAAAGAEVRFVRRADETRWRYTAQSKRY